MDSKICEGVDLCSPKIFRYDVLDYNESIGVNTFVDDGVACPCYLVYSFQGVSLNIRHLMNDSRLFAVAEVGL